MWGRGSWGSWGSWGSGVGGRCFEFQNIVLLSSSGFSYKHWFHGTDSFTVMNDHEVTLKTLEIIIPGQIDKTEGQADVKAS